jgi:DNA polymerase-3 subunit epsilon
MLQLIRPLAVIDLEATGMNLSSDRIIEIAIIKIMPDGRKLLKRKLINPEMEISASSTEIHGITNDMVREAPTFRQAANEIRQFIDNADLAGYNSNRFDIPMLVEEFLRISLDLDMKNRKLIDVQKIFHSMEQRTLSAAYKFYCNCTLENAHSAEADAMATWEVLQSQVERYPQLGLTIDTILKCIGEENTVDFARRMIMENGREIFNFGKHKGRAVTDVLKAEPQYYDWMMKGDFPLHTKQKLTEVFNRMMLKKG